LVLEKITSLDHPPMVGETYLVPALRHTEWGDVERDWPMFGLSARDYPAQQQAASPLAC
jgi:hypothetical protein